MRGLRLLPVLIALAAAAETAAAELPIQVPEFSGHEIPVPLPPPARSELLEYLDVAFLLVALVLASLLALVWRSRRGLFLLAVVSLVWLGFWRQGCVCPIGAIQNVTLAVFDPTYVIPLAVVLFFTLPLVVTLFAGRTFCASVCPLGAIQELVAVWPRRIPVWLEHSLGLLAYVYLGLVVLCAATSTADEPVFLICRYDPFVGLFRLSGAVNMLVLGGCFLVVGLFVGRPYCRFLCPYGAVLALLSKASKWHVKVPPEDCIQCRLCEEVCPYNAIREPTVAQRVDERLRGRRRLAMLLGLLPALVALGVWLGGYLQIPLSRLHSEVRLAEQVRREELGQAPATTEASDAFRASGRAPEALYREAFRKTRQMGVGARLFGAWVALVVGVKLVHLSIRRRRADYLPDRANCLSCGRCFWYCPGEQARRGRVRTVPSAAAADRAAAPTSPVEVAQ